MTDTAVLHGGMNADLEAATAAAQEAAAAILAVKDEARAGRSMKADDSPVTAADLAADVILRRLLGKNGDVVVSEEAWPSATLPTTGRVWIVDPIDGTEDFVAGRADYVVQVGLVVDGRPVLGVVLQPETGRIWRGVVSAGHCESIDGGVVTRRSLPASGTLSGPPRIAASISHPTALVDFVVAELGGIVLPIGSVGLKIGAIVDGRADAYVTGSRRIKVWDTLAPVAVLLAAGGAVTGLAQRPLPYDAAVLHDDGVCAWSVPARTSLLPRLAEALARFSAGG